MKIIGNYSIDEFKAELRNNKINLKKEQCEYILDYIQTLEKEKQIWEEVNGRLNNKLLTIKESFKDLIDRV